MPRHRLLFAFLLASLSIPSIHSDAQDSSITEDKRSAEAEPIPEGRTIYLGRRIARTMSFHGANWLIRNERESQESTREALRQLQLKPGMTVCDLGCGNGFYAIEMAKLVAPAGKVYAVDIQAEMLHLLELRAKEAEVKNIVPVHSTIVDPRLPDGEIDLVLMVDVYHEFSHPVLMLAAIRKSLSEKGVIALLEYREEDPKVPILPLHKMSKKQIYKEYKANGFREARQYNKLPWQHLIFFERDPDWHPPTPAKTR